jgi:hypothetical protein
VAAAQATATLAAPGVREATAAYLVVPVVAVAVARPMESALQLAERVVMELGAKWCSKRTPDKCLASYASFGSCQSRKLLATSARSSTVS